MSFKKIYSLSLKESRNSITTLNVIMLWSGENEKVKHFIVVLNTFIKKNENFIAKKSSWLTLKFDEFKDLHSYMEEFEEGVVDSISNKRIRFKPSEKRKNYFEISMFRWHEPYRQKILLHRRQVDKINTNYDRILEIIHEYTK